jgi:hypothetical protein
MICRVLRQLALAYAFVFSGRALGKRFSELQVTFSLFPVSHVWYQCRVYTCLG